MLLKRCARQRLIVIKFVCIPVSINTFDPMWPLFMTLEIVFKFCTVWHKMMSVTPIHKQAISNPDTVGTDKGCSVGSTDQDTNGVSVKQVIVPVMLLVATASNLVCLCDAFAAGCYHTFVKASEDSKQTIKYNDHDVIQYHGLVVFSTQSLEWPALDRFVCSFCSGEQN